MYSLKPGEYFCIAKFFYNTCRRLCVWPPHSITLVSAPGCYTEGRYRYVVFIAHSPEEVYSWIESLGVGTVDSLNDYALNFWRGPLPPRPYKLKQLSLFDF